MREPAWLSRRTVEAIHKRQLARHDGAAGLRDPGLLESALMRALNAWSYGETDLCELASLYAEALRETTHSLTATSELHSSRRRCSSA